ncbi:MAG: 30S ribosomal protein S9 [Planctomycetes bacterium]|nr:30S ribosomal protein S9 [Planctomycetota bacterium]
MIDKAGYYWGTGRRKTSVARVRIKEGTGTIVINKKDIDDFLPRERDRFIVRLPLKTTKCLDKFDVFVNVNGGGITGQAGAASLGIARALLKSDQTLADRLRSESLLTRDSRMVERKKYGQKGARKSFQWTKR